MYQLGLLKKGPFKKYILKLWVYVFSLYLFYCMCLMSPELLLHLRRRVARDDEHLVHVVPQHVAGVADVHRRL